MSIFVYPGSFDPVTNGHLDIIDRAASICDKLVVGVLQNRSKNSLFSIDERVELLKKAIGDRSNIEICSFSGLLVEFVKEKNAGVIIKGLRAISDYEYELQMAHLNKRMCENVETLFMMAGLNYSYLSSSVVKDIAMHGGNIEGLVPDEILNDIIKKIKTKISVEECAKDKTY